MFGVGLENKVFEACTEPFSGWDTCCCLERDITSERG